MIIKNYNIDKINPQRYFNKFDEIVSGCISELRKCEVGNDLLIEINLPDKPFQECYNLYDYVSEKIENAIKSIPNIKEILIGGNFVEGPKSIRVKFKSYEKQELSNISYRIKKIFNRHIEIAYVGIEEIN